MAYEKNSLSFISSTLISSTLKRGTATIARWIKAYKQGGTKQLMKRSHEGRKASLPQDIQLKLIEIISGQYKTAKEIQTWLQTAWLQTAWLQTAWLQTDCGVYLKLSAIYYWLRQLLASPVTSQLETATTKP